MASDRIADSQWQMANGKWQHHPHALAVAQNSQWQMASGKWAGWSIWQDLTCLRRVLGFKDSKAR